MIIARIAKWLRHRLLKPTYAGSNPAAGATMLEISAILNEANPMTRTDCKFANGLSMQEYFQIRDKM